MAKCSDCGFDSCQCKALALDADREMLGDDADYFDNAGIDNIGCK